MMESRINIFILKTLIVSLLFIIKCEDKEWRNPFDPNNTISIEKWSPKNLGIEHFSDRNIKLKWEYDCNQISGFRIDRKIRDSEWVTDYAIVKKNAREFIDDNISLNEIYRYRLYAYASNNNSKAVESWIYIKPDHYFTVPDEYTTIQEAINNAIDGDTIIVYPGIYYENINYYGKDLVVGSLFFPTMIDSFVNNTIIDGNLNGSVVSFEHGETSKAVLSGFIITNGTGKTIEWAENFYEYKGGGIYCKNSNPIIMNTLITNNNLTGKFVEGGGIYCDHSSPKLVNVIVADNSVDGEFAKGGGLCCREYSNPILENVSFVGNCAKKTGGGIYCFYSSYPTLCNCILYDDKPDEIFLDTYINHPSCIYILYSDVEGGKELIVINNENNVIKWEIGNLNIDPLFIDYQQRNFHLKSNSPCKNSGNPSSLCNDPDGSRNDMGAYGGPGGDW